MDIWQLVTDAAYSCDREPDNELPALKAVFRAFRNQAEPASGFEASALRRLVAALLRNRNVDVDAVDEEVCTDNYVGGCPTCGKDDGFLNVSSGHYFVCYVHQVYWCIGINLFSGWKHEDEAVWRRNADILATMKEVEPLHGTLLRKTPPPTSSDPKPSSHQFDPDFPF